MIRAVISDFGGVLTMPLTGSFHAFAEELGIELAAIGHAFAALAERNGANPLHELECGRITEEAFLAELQRALSDVSGREVELGAFAETLWAGLLPNEPMIALMALLRAEGYRMALLTNNVREWAERWRAMVPIDDIFELVIDSAFVGMRKPEPAIYELAVARLGVPADECLFVDDREDNCAGARAVGMSAVVYRDVEQAVAEIRGALDGGRDGRRCEARGSAVTCAPALGESLVS
ncbi:MAG: HAD family phosphatase [Actinobacteria bacterium]|nr:HAD family phosphatase [Actinomycetota bacterium]